MQRIYFQMGHIFLHQDVYGEALNAQRKALGYKHLAVDSVSEVFILKDLGATYAAQGKTDSAFLYYQEALQKAETTCNASVRFYVKEDMAALHLRLGEYDKAWHLLDAPPADMDASVQATLYRLKAQLFHRTGQPDSALYYCRLLTREGSSVYDRQAASLEMAGIFTGQGRFQDAVNQYCQYVTYTDSVQKLIRTAAISKAQSTYNYRLRERENNQLKLKKRRAAHPDTGLPACRCTHHRRRHCLPAPPAHQPAEAKRTYQRTGAPTGRTIHPKPCLH